uniref:Reverse transcriptase domain-containing protein n=1 Tax=Tanacetum cinerariifolium TaxID=118510 RepID=A0A6L2JIH9_TANCI|nr:reverse transcriptase domain-containing protein [Tanacetum cinerariifolium]
MEEYCLGNAIKKLKKELWNHVRIGADIDKYTTRFHELAKLVLHTVTPESKRIDRYIRGLAPAIRGTMKTSRFRTFSIAAKEAQQDPNVVTNSVTQRREFRSSWRTSRREPETVENHESERAKVKDIPVVRHFPGVILEDLSGLLPYHEVEFRIDLIPGAMPIVKSTYCLAPTEMQELSNQLKEH